MLLLKHQIFPDYHYAELKDRAYMIENLRIIKCSYGALHLITIVATRVFNNKIARVIC